MTTNDPSTLILAALSMLSLFFDRRDFQQPLKLKLVVMEQTPANNMAVQGARFSIHDIPGKAEMNSAKP